MTYFIVYCWGIQLESDELRYFIISAHHFQVECFNNAIIFSKIEYLLQMDQPNVTP